MVTVGRRLRRAISVITSFLDDGVPTETAAGTDLVEAVPE